MAEEVTEDPVKIIENPKYMSVVREYRIILPISVEEYHIAQLYGVAEASKNETGGGEGIEVKENKPKKYMLASDPNKEVKDAQYTEKIFHLQSKVPSYVKKMAPSGSLEMMEIAYNGYPYCRTVYSNPQYMKDKFVIDIETRHEQGNGSIENIHNLQKEELSKREIVWIDIANDPCDARDYKESEDPTKFKSEKTGRGPLGKDWTKSAQPIMCCYKLYRVYFKWFGFQTLVEKMIMKSVRRILYNFHRQVFCWMDKWHGMTIEDIRALEDKTKEELDELRSTGPVRGTKE